MGGIQLLYMLKKLELAILVGLQNKITMINFFYQIMPEINNYEQIGLKSFLISLIVILLASIRYLYKSKEKGQKEHKEDLKFFDSERQKTVNEISQMFHKISVWIEQINSRNNGK